MIERTGMSQKRIRGYPLSTYLILIVMIAVIPFVIFSVVVVDRLISAKQELSERYLAKAADELAMAVDQEIIATVRTLDAMSKSASLQRNDLSTFYGVANRVLKSQDSWSTILLHRPDLTWLVNVNKPFNSKLGPVAEPDSLLKVVETNGPVIGKVIKIPKTVMLDAEFGFAVRVPVKNQKNEIIYILSAIITTDAIEQLVKRYTFAPDEWTRAIVDPMGTLAARSREPEKYVGGRASQTLLTVLEKNLPSGLEKTKTLEGIEAYTAYRRAPFSGWYAALAVSADEFDASTLQVRNAVAGLGLILLIFSTLATLFFSGWMRKTISAGAQSAADLSRGEEPRMARSAIKEMEELRQSLRNASVLLRSREKAKSDFLANMSHELRTPLGILLGMTEQLSKGEIPKHEELKIWEILKRNGQQLSRLIDDILDFAKVEANRLTIESINFSLPDLISSVAEDFNSLIREKNIRLKVVIEEGSPTIINSDPVRLRQILVNLVGNAVKFTHIGSIELKLHRSKENKIRITVTDTGIGLTDEQQQNLFSDFTQGDSSHTRKYGGTGLGLSLSRKMARRLGGDVKLMQSQPQLGSTFEMTVSSNVMTTPSLEKLIKSQPQKLNPLATHEVLLAEDSLDNIYLIKSYLKNSSVNITVAMTGLEAVKFAKEKQFDLILMDIQMPDMDGFEATRQIRENLATLPIIALTAHALPEQKTKALNSGFTDYLTKPIRKDVLLGALARHLNS